MPEITAKGRKLADKLAPAIGVGVEIRETCSLICRHAVTHHRIQEVFCNGGDDWRDDASRQRQIEAAERRDVEIEARITELVEMLPPTDAGPLGAYFQGDPRGCTVGLTAPAPWTSLYDGWGRDRINVP